MNKNHFIENFRKAFGNYELPIAIWYSEKPVAIEDKTRGCFIKYLKPARDGNIVSLSLETISYPGAKTIVDLREWCLLSQILFLKKNAIKKLLIWLLILLRT